MFARSGTLTLVSQACLILGTWLSICMVCNMSAISVQPLVMKISHVNIITKSQMKYSFIRVREVILV